MHARGCMYMTRVRQTSAATRKRSTDLLDDLEAREDTAWPPAKASRAVPLRPASETVACA